MTDVIVSEIDDQDLRKKSEAIENAHLRLTENAHHRLTDLKINENRQRWSDIALAHVNIDDQSHVNAIDIAHKVGDIREEACKGR